MTWRMRWYLIIIITIAYTIGLIGGLIGFGMTKDPRYLLFISPTGLIPFVYHLVPIDKKKQDLKLAKVRNNEKLVRARVQIHMLKAELNRQQRNGNTSSAAKNLKIPVNQEQP